MYMNKLKGSRQLSFWYLFYYMFRPARAILWAKKHIKVIYMLLIKNLDVSLEIFG